MRIIIRPPSGAGIRVFLGLYLLAIGIGYLITHWTGSTKTTSYLIQASYAPLWLYGIGLGGVGIALLATWRKRRKWWGRSVGGVSLVLLSFIIGTWIEARAWTGVLGYIVLIWASLVEIGFVDEG
jgi:hypothetical protein